MSARVKRPREWRMDVVRSVHFYQQIISRTALASDRRWADALLEDAYPPKLAMRCLEDAAHEGLIEYGVSVRTARLTDKGKALLRSGYSGHAEPIP